MEAKQGQKTFENIKAELLKVETKFAALELEKGNILVNFEVFIGAEPGNTKLHHLHFQVNGLIDGANR